MSDPKSKSSNQEELVTVQEAADILEVSKATIYTLNKRGLLKIYKRLFRGSGAAQSYLKRTEVEHLKEHPFEVMP